MWKTKINGKESCKELRSKGFEENHLHEYEMSQKYRNSTEHSDSDPGDKNIFKKDRKV